MATAYLLSAGNTHWIFELPTTTTRIAHTIVPRRHNPPPPPVYVHAWCTCLKKATYMLKTHVVASAGAKQILHTIHKDVYELKWHLFEMFLAHPWKESELNFVVVIVYSLTSNFEPTSNEVPSLEVKQRSRPKCRVSQAVMSPIYKCSTEKNIQKPHEDESMGKYLLMFLVSFFQLDDTFEDTVVLRELHLSALPCFLWFDIWYKRFSFVGNTRVYGREIYVTEMLLVS